MTCANCGHSELHNIDSPIGLMCSHERDEDRWVEGVNGVGGYVGGPWLCGCNDYEPEEPHSSDCAVWCGEPCDCPSDRDSDD